MIRTYKVGIIATLLITTLAYITTACTPAFSSPDSIARGLSTQAAQLGDLERKCITVQMNDDNVRDINGNVIAKTDYSMVAGKRQKKYGEKWRAYFDMQYQAYIKAKEQVSDKNSIPYVSYNFFFGTKEDCLDSYMNTNN
jgi:hypothetical protein